MNDTDRPLPITVICIFGFLGSLLSIFFAMDLSRHGAASWTLPFAILCSISGFACFGGMMMMKRWGILLYTAMMVITEVCMLALGAFAPKNLIAPGIIIAIGFYYFGDMD